MGADRWPRFAPQGDAALVVAFGEGIDAAVNNRVMALDAALRATPLAGMVATLPSFCSLLLQYDPVDHDFAEIAAGVRALLAALPDTPPRARLVTIPACYDAALAPDLIETASLAGLAPDEVVRLHTAHTYRVHMLGFMPGFAYMASLPERLRLPRLKTPRLRVPARSVAIAMEMTAIYPLQSPGGWRLIGAVPVDLFAITADPPSLLRAGDAVRFRAVGHSEFDDLRAAWTAGALRLDIAAAAP